MGRLSEVHFLTNVPLRAVRRLARRIGRSAFMAMAGIVRSNRHLTVGSIHRGSPVMSATEMLLRFLGSDVLRLWL